jgi:hypothetical protein
MATPKASLLGLPRELRDMIYEHLTENLHFPYRCNKHVWGDRCMMEVHNAPLLDVLLVNSQIHSEYLQAGCHEALRITIHIDSVQKIQNDEAYAFKDRIQFTRAALARARHITVFIGTTQLYRWCHGDLWAPIVCLFAGALTALTKKMSFLQLAIQEDHNYGMGYLSHLDFLGGVIPFPAESRCDFIPSPPSSLSGLPLIQRGEGYRLATKNVVDVRYIKPHSSYQHHMIPGRDWLLYHGVSKVGVYIYGREQNLTSYWDKQEIVDEWELPNGPQYLERFQSASDDETAKIEKLPYEVMEWKEKRGDEVMTWDVDGDKGDTWKARLG